MALILFALVLAAFATPIADPTPTLRYLPNVLTLGPKAYTVPCVVAERWLVLAGGWDSSGSVDTVEVFDMLNEVVVSNGTISTSRDEYGIVPWGNGCVVVAGFNTVAGVGVKNVDYIEIDAATGKITNITQLPDYTNSAGNGVYDLSCAVVPSDSNIYCFGGDTETTYASYYNGTGWTRLPDIPVSFGWDSDYGTGIVVFDGKVWICDDKSGSTYFDFCQVFDPATATYANVTTFSSDYVAALAVVKYPVPTLVRYGGYNSTGAVIGTVATVTGSAGAYTVTVTETGVPLAYVGDSFTTNGPIVYTFGGDIGAYVPYLVAVNVQNAAAPTAYVAAVATDPATVVSGSAPAYDSGAGATYGQKLFYCALYSEGEAAYATYCFAFDLSCQGNSTTGFDSWVAGVGCDKVNCYKNFYGSACTACSCSGQACNDGFYGDGVCTCNANSYGTDCSQTQTCSGNGIPADGINGNGTCVCNDGYHGADCSLGPVVCSVNSAFNRVDGTCACLPGYYGSDCSSQCNCNGSPCDDGNTGTGACTCSPNTFGAGCAGSCACGGGVCSDGVNGDGSCACPSGYYGADCAGVCSCPPVVYSPTEIKIFRCDDGSSGTGACIRLYSSATFVSTFFGLIVLCLSLFFF